MNNHEHKECEHLGSISYCKKCDVCYCTECGKEWSGTWGNITWTTPNYRTGGTQLYGTTISSQIHKHNQNET